MQSAFKMGYNPSEAVPFEKAQLYRSIEQAKTLGFIKLPVEETAKLLIRFIPAGAAQPVSPVRVSRIAKETGYDVRTVRRHINQLMALGIVRKNTLDGGHRACYRSTNDITYIAGIDFTPLLDLQDQLQTGIEAHDAEIQHCDRLRAQISHMRADIKAMIKARPAPSEILELFAALPRRIAELGLSALEETFSAVESVLTQLRDFLKKSDKMSDQSDSCVRQYTTSNISTVLSNRTIPIKKAEKNISSTEIDGPRPRSERQDSDIETIGRMFDTKLAYALSPTDWIDDLNSLSSTPGWSEFAMIAEMRASANGIWPQKFKSLKDSLGLPVLVFLVMLMDHNGPSGTRKIKRPVGWMLSMESRIFDGNANLTKSLFGLIKDQTHAK